MTLLLAMVFTAARAAEGGTYAVLGVTTMGDDCCAQKVVAALDAVSFVSGAAASPATGQACVRFDGAPDAARLGAAFGPALDAAGYTLGNIDVVDACPDELVIGPADPWAGAAGIDLAHVSRGEVFDLKASLVPGKFTIVDVGAPWCGPCFTAAERLEAYARANADVAVRVVTLDGADAKASFAQPVVKQHFGFAEALPYFVAYGPTGASVYTGTDLDALLRAIDRKRK